MYVDEQAIPLFAGFGAVPGALPYFSQANPPQVFVQAFQTYMGVPATGVWDRATHAAASALLATVYANTVEGQARIDMYGGGLPAWGTHLDLLAAWFGAQFLALPTTASSTATISEQGRRLLDLLGLPSTSVADLVAVTSANRAAVEKAQADTLAYIVAAESTPGGTGGVAVPWYKRTSTYVIGGLGALVVIGGVALARRGRS